MRTTLTLSVWVVQFIATLMLQRNCKGLIIHIWFSLYYCICHFPLVPCVSCSFYSKPKSTLCTAITRQHTAESIINWHAQDTTTLQPYVVFPGMLHSLVINIKWSDFVHCHHDCQGQAHFVSQLQYTWTVYTCDWNQYNANTVVNGTWAVWPRNFGLIPGRDERFISCSELLDMLWDPSSLLSSE